MSVILDSGAFLAVERGDRDIVAMVKQEHEAGRDPLTHGGVVAQVWRSGVGRQAPVARLLKATLVVPLGIDLGKQAGTLLALSGSGDAIDAAVVSLARNGDRIVTSDPIDLTELALAAGVRVAIVRA